MHLDIDGTGGAFMTSLWQLKRFEARISLFKSLDCPLALAAAGMNQRFTRYPPVINYYLGWCNWLQILLTNLERGFLSVVLKIIFTFFGWFNWLMADTCISFYITLASPFFTGLLMFDYSTVQMHCDTYRNIYSQTSNIRCTKSQT